MSIKVTINDLASGPNISLPLRRNFCTIRVVSTILFYSILKRHASFILDIEARLGSNIDEN